MLLATTLITAGILAAAAPTPPPSARAADSTWHPNADSAALQAFRQMTDTAQSRAQVESAGGIVRREDGQHSYTVPVGQTQHDHFAVRVQLAAGEHFAGLYHNHPGKDADAAYFSPDDIALANRLNVPSYIRFDDGSVRKYTPGVTKTMPLPNGGHMAPKVAYGDPVVEPAPATAAAPATPTQEQKL